MRWATVMIPGIPQRGEPTSAILNQYTHGVVIWAVPYWGYVTEYGSASISALKSYLDAGGRLFITGQNIAQALQYSWYGSRTFLNDYLHVTFRQEHTGLYALAGAAGDPIGNGLALNISGGDGANNQYSLDEVDPITLAEVIFTYQAGVSAMLAEPFRPEADAPGSPQALAAPETDAPAAPAGNVGSGTAGVRVDAGKYRAVFLAFGFEAINSAADRQVVMARVLNWLAPFVSLVHFICLLVFARSAAPDSFLAARNRKRRVVRRSTGQSRTPRRSTSTIKELRARARLRYVRCRPTTYMSCGPSGPRRGEQHRRSPFDDFVVDELPRP